MALISIKIRKTKLLIFRIIDFEIPYCFNQPDTSSGGLHLANTVTAGFKYNDIQDTVSL